MRLLSDAPVSRLAACTANSLIRLGRIQVVRVVVFFLMSIDVSF